MPATPTTPNGCHHCGIPLPHGQQFTEAAGLHGWVQPTDAQILARMIARRTATA